MKTIAAFLASALVAFSGTAATSTPVIQNDCATIDHTLQFGSRGVEVSILQKILAVESTGYFGPTTRLKLIDWQIKHGLIVSAKSAGAGVAGPKTRAALKCPRASTEAPVTKIPVSINPPTAAPSTTSIPTTTPPLPQLNPVSSGGGSGYGGNASAPKCEAFTTPQPPAAQCATGPWEIIPDEAGCPADWNCSDPNATQ